MSMSIIRKCAISLNIIQYKLLILIFKSKYIKIGTQNILQVIGKTTMNPINVYLENFNIDDFLIDEEMRILIEIGRINSFDV